MPPDGGEGEGGSGPGVDIAHMLEVAKLLHRNGHLGEAESFYETILETAPDHADTLQSLGLLKHFRGQSDEGLTLIRQALALEPNAPNLHNNLGRVLADSGQPAEAEAAYRSALGLEHGHLEALLNLGMLAESLDRPGEAETFYRRALAIDIGHAPAQDRIMPLLFEQGRFAEAYTLGAQFVEVRPREPASLKQLVTIYTALGQTEKALAVVAEALAADPQDEVMLHLGTALSGKGVPPRAGDAFVVQLFDEFAHRFERTLSALDYRAPDLVAAAMLDLVGSPREALDILDAGCGTGLCGPLLRPHARRLVGVDLSSKMVDAARERADYDELHVAELVQYLRAHPRAFDVAVSADTLCYFGDLQDFAAAAAGALRPGGLLVFTVEEAEAGATKTFRLAPHGRYQHHRDYVLACLGTAGFSAPAARPDALRKEAGKPIRGLVVTARMPA